MNAKLSELLRATLAKTEARALTWQSFDENSFHVRIGAGALHIQRLPPPPDEGSYSVDRYSLQVSDGLGRIVLETLVFGGEEGFQLCDDLFHSVQKNSSDTLLDEMLNALGSPRRAS